MAALETQVDISVVSPVYGCKSCLEDLVTRVASVLGTDGRSFEIILVDDCSPDDAWPRIAELAKVYPFVRGLRLSRNFGQHPAISAGLSASRGDIVVVMDCDLQDVPEEIPNLLAPLSESTEVVLGMRVDRQDSWFKKAGSRVFYKTLGWLTDTHFDASTANFGAYRRSVIDAVVSMPEADRYFPLMIHWSGFRTRRVPVAHAARTSGKSSYTLRSLMALASRIVLSFSDKPLRLLIRLGFFFCVFAVAVVAYSIYSYAEGRVSVAGYTSLLASIWLIGGAMIMGVGVVGVYVGRIFNQVKRRPNFIVAEETNAGGMYL